MATSYATNDHLNNLLTQLNQVREQGQFSQVPQLPKPQIPPWLQAAQGASQAPMGYSGVTAQGGGAGVSQGSTDTLSRLVRAIRGQESSGNYRARNGQSGAAGAYQILPSNFTNPGGWDKEALGRDISLNEFLNSPQLQDTIARYKLGQYLNQYGDAGAAVAWYAGPGNVKNMYSTKTQTGGYPSLYAYWKSVLAKM